MSEIPVALSNTHTSTPTSSTSHLAGKYSTWRFTFRERPRLLLNWDNGGLQRAVSQATLRAELTVVPDKEAEARQAGVDEAASQSTGEASRSLRCWVGDETRVDVAMPERCEHPAIDTYTTAYHKPHHRPMDVSFTAYDRVPIDSKAVPRQLKHCLSNMSTS